MDLIPNFPSLGLVFNERHHVLEFLLAPRLESRRIMEDEPRAALEDELITNIMDTSL
jgi:hypothetical protein